MGAAVGGGGVAPARGTVAPARFRWGTKAVMGPPRFLFPFFRFASVYYSSCLCGYPCCVSRRFNY